jgi:hypothetical protein
VTGQISAQDLRDFLVTVMPEEFLYTTDFWNQPLNANLTAEGVRGWLMYSQVMDSAVSFGEVIYMTPSGTWKRAMASDSDMNALLALAGADIASDGSGTILRRGLIFKSAYSGIFNGYTGRPIYLESAAVGSIVGPGSTAPTSAKIIGIIEDDDSAIYRFDPDWSVVGT